MDFLPMNHGGDITTYRDLYDGELVDFSSNINPLGPPEGLYDELKNNFNSLTIYPDIQYRTLKSNIGKYLNCDCSNIVVGNGAVEVINNFIQLFDRVVTFVPCFSEYEKRGKVLKKEICKIPLSPDFTIDIDSVKRNLKKGDILILGNPNNPTGLRIEEDKLKLIYDIVNLKESFLLLDEAFFEFCPKDYDSIKMFKDKDYDRIAIIRAVTKFFALPGIRLGYACTSNKMARKYEKVELPWSINSLADCSGRYIFGCKEYIEKSKNYIQGERQYMTKALMKIKFINLYPTQSNYILIKSRKFNENFLFYYFLKRGILIRKCSSFDGLDDKHIRLAIKNRKNNERVIKIFKELENVEENMS